MQNERMTGIGGGDTPRILAVSPFGGPMAVYLEKTGARHVEVTELMQWGLRLEAAIADEFAERNNCKVRRYHFHRHKDMPWFVGHPDRIITGKREGLEIKNASLWTRDKWGDENTDVIPPHIIIQCQHYMALMGYDRWHVAALIGGNEYKQYTLEADAELQETIIQKANQFWFDHVQKGIPPDPDHFPEWEDHLKQKYPEDLNPVREATESELHDILELRTARENLKKAEEIAKAIENRVKCHIGDDGGLAFDGGKITWRKAKDTKRTAWKDVAKDLNPDPEIIERHTKITEGSRRFLAKFAS